jgi:hypothetical protein
VEGSGNQPALPRLWDAPVFSLMIHREARLQGDHFVATAAGIFTLALIFIDLSRKFDTSFMRRPFRRPHHRQ